MAVQFVVQKEILYTLVFTFLRCLLLNKCSFDTVFAEERSKIWKKLMDCGQPQASVIRVQ